MEPCSNRPLKDIVECVSKRLYLLGPLCLKHGLRYIKVEIATAQPQQMITRAALLYLGIA